MLNKSQGLFSFCALPVRNGTRSWKRAWPGQLSCLGGRTKWLWGIWLLAVIKTLWRKTHLNPTFSILDLFNTANLPYEPQPPKAEILHVRAYKTSAWLTVYTCWLPHFAFILSLSYYLIAMSWMISSCFKSNSRKQNNFKTLKYHITE